MTTNESILKLLTYDGEDRLMHYLEFLKEHQEVNTSVKRFHCDFPMFDKKIEGLETGEVFVVTGHTKNGKTLFAESWLNSMLRVDPDARPAIFSFEVQTQKLLMKYPNDPSLHIYVPRQLKSMDFDWLKERCHEAKLKYDCQIVLIDHLHFLIDMNIKQNLSLNIGAFMRKLKQEIAIGLNMAVILIAHQSQPKEGQSASASNIRDSSFVGQESDGVIVVSRKKNYNAVELKDIEIQRGEEIAGKIRPPVKSLDDHEFDPEMDEYSAGLAVVQIAYTRRSGVFNSKKLFVKKGSFVEEV